MAKKEKRIPPHIVETRSRDNIRSLIDRDGIALLRDLTERDYGIDAIMELFEDGCVTGKFALLQLKGKEHKIVPLKGSEEISCSISVEYTSDSDLCKFGGKRKFLLYCATKCIDSCSPQETGKGAR